MTEVWMQCFGRWWRDEAYIPVGPQPHSSIGRSIQIENTYYLSELTIQYDILVY